MIRPELRPVVTWSGMPVEVLGPVPTWAVREADETGALVRMAVVVGVGWGGIPVAVPLAELMIETSTADKLVTCVTPGGGLEDG